MFGTFINHLSIFFFQDNVPAADRDGTAKNFLRTLARAVTGSSLNYGKYLIISSCLLHVSK